MIFLTIVTPILLAIYLVIDDALRPTQGLSLSCQLSNYILPPVAAVFSWYGYVWPALILSSLYLFGFIVSCLVFYLFGGVNEFRKALGNYLGVDFIAILPAIENRPIPIPTGILIILWFVGAFKTFF